MVNSTDMSADKLTILKGSEVPIEGLLGKQVLLVGYGNQGAAHAKNMRESGIDVSVCTRQSEQPTSDGFQIASIEEAGKFDLVIIGLPDDVQKTYISDQLIPNLTQGTTVGFIHGFTVHYNLCEFPEGIGVVMVAPKGPGKTLRDTYKAGKGIPSLMAIHQENADNTARAIALGWAAGLGSSRAGVIETTFKDETETDLFGEQTIIVGGMLALMKASYETLVEAGYPKHLAYIECCHEVKQVADLVYEQGIAHMLEAISDTAELGAYAAIDELDDDTLRTKLRNILKYIQEGTFAQDMINQNIKHMRDDFKASEIEKIGEKIRSFMPKGTDG